MLDGYHKQVAKTYVIEKKELDTKSCPTCDKTFSECEQSLWVSLTYMYVHTRSHVAADVANF